MRVSYAVPQDALGHVRDGFAVVRLVLYVAVAETSGIEGVNAHRQERGDAVFGGRGKHAGLAAFRDRPVHAGLLLSDGTPEVDLHVAVGPVVATIAPVLRSRGAPKLLV